MDLKQFLWTYQSGLKHIQSLSELTTAELHNPVNIRTAEPMPDSEGAVGYTDL